MNKLLIISVSNDFVKAFPQLNLDYSLESLNDLEEYITLNTISEGKFKKGSFFAKDTELNIFSYGCYSGEVIRRKNKDIRWDLLMNENVVSFSLINSTKDNFDILEKARKRVFLGEGENVFAAAIFFLKNSPAYHNNTEQFDQEDLRIMNHYDQPIVKYSKYLDNQQLPSRIIINEGDVIFISNEDLAEENNSLESYELKFLEEVKQIHPSIPDIDFSRGDYVLLLNADNSYRDQTPHSGLFFDSNSMASFQGSFNLDILQWIKFNPESVVKRAFFLLFFGFATIYKFHWIFLVLFIVILFLNIRYWAEVKNKFKGGDINPGRVISLDPLKVATITNMGKSGGGFPILKIFETNLPEEDKYLGKNIPTIALYGQGMSDLPFWVTFEPVALSLGVKNRNSIDEIISQFTEEDLNQLELSIKQVNSDQPGIYKVDYGVNDWKNFESVDINDGIFSKIKKDDTK